MRYFVGGILILITCSCGFKYHDSISGNGKVKDIILSKDMVEDLEISDNINVSLISSDTSTIILRADENLHSIIISDLTKGKLKVSSPKLIRMARAKDVLIYGKKISHIKLFKHSSFRSRDTLKFTSLRCELSIGSKAEITGVFDTLIIEACSRSSVHLMGKQRISQEKN